MQLFHLYHNQKFYKAIHSDFALFDILVWLHTFARSLIAVFIPIFLFRLGYSLNAIILYYIAMNVVDVPMNFVAEKLTSKIGARRVIILATIASIAYFIILYNLPAKSFLLLFVLAAVDGIYDALYYVSHLYLFIKSSREGEDTGKDTGILYSIRIFGGMLGPLLGALVLLFGNSKFLIGTSIVIFALSIIPLLSLRHTENKPLEKRMPFRKFMANGIEKRNFTSIILTGIHGVSEGVLWPLFIYTLFNLESVAYIALLVSFSTIVFSYFTGHIKAAKQMKLLVFGSALVGIIWILRLLITENAFYYISVILIGFCSLLVSIPLDTSIFSRGRTSDALRASTYRNFFGMSGQLIFFVILGVLVEVFKVGFTLAAASMFLLATIASLFLATSRKPYRQEAPKSLS